MTDVLAHSLPDKPVEFWERLGPHATAVVDLVTAFARPLGLDAAAALAALLHDIGKCSPEFQAYIRAAADRRGPDHSTAGALEARRLYPRRLGRVLAFVIAGHHAGLADGSRLYDRLKGSPPSYAGWEDEVGPLPDAAAVTLPTPVASRHRGFSDAFLIRMLFSCLVDADFIATERFYAKAEGTVVDRETFTSLPVLNERLTAFMKRKRDDAEPTPVNGLRAEVFDHVLGKAVLAPGLFTLTVPTGGGKTLAFLAFALEHARLHGLRRVIYAIPFASVTEQVAEVFREALAAEPDTRNDEDVLEHHATFDWDAARRRGGGPGDEDGRGNDPVDRLRRAAENWAAPIVVTTTVQFFESLFANRTSRCRKLHNIVGSVIVLDEAQTLPLHLLRPCLAVLEELTTNYGVSIVLCTATQPAVRVQDGFDQKSSSVSAALDIPADRELAPDPVRLYESPRRVTVEHLKGPTEDAAIAARFAEQSQMLCIVNTRAHAQALYTAIKHMEGATHLSTLMCPRHRRTVLEAAKARLREGRPVRLVSTSLIEAGVDIDFPEVWRAATGLEAVAQSAGRANREGRLAGLGRLVVFEPAGRKAPHEAEQGWQAARSVLRRFADPLGLDAVRAYFKDFYWMKGAEALDAATLEKEPYPILRKIEAYAPQWGEADPPLAFPFESIAKAFRVIDDVMEPVIVPWSSGPDDKEAETILARIAGMDKPLGGDLRKLQQYVVGIPARARSEWLALGVLRPVHPALGEALLRFDGIDHYDPEMGVRVGAILERSPESNLM